MQLRRDANIEASFIHFFRFFAELLAGLQVVIHRFVECLLKLFDRAAFKSHRIVDADDFAKKHLVFGAEMDAGKNTLRIVRCQSSLMIPFSLSEVTPSFSW